MNKISDSVSYFGYGACVINVIALFLTIWFYPLDFSKYQKEKEKAGTYFGPTPAAQDIEPAKDGQPVDEEGEAPETLLETEKPALRTKAGAPRKSLEEREFEKLYARASTEM